MSTLLLRSHLQYPKCKDRNKSDYYNNLLIYANVSTLVKSYWIGPNVLLNRTYPQNTQHDKILYVSHHLEQSLRTVAHSMRLMRKCDLLRIRKSVSLWSLPVKGKVSLIWPLDQLGKPICSIADYYWACLNVGLLRRLLWIRNPSQSEQDCYSTLFIVCCLNFGVPNKRSLLVDCQL